MKTFYRKDSIHFSQNSGVLALKKVRIEESFVECSLFLEFGRADIVIVGSVSRTVRI